MFREFKILSGTVLVISEREMEMPRDIIEDYMKTPYENWRGEMIEITHVEVTYYVPSDDNKRVVVLPIGEANELANRKGVNGPYVSKAITKEEAIERGYLK